MYTGCRICSLSHRITVQTTSREREIFTNHFSFLIQNLACSSWEGTENTYTIKVWKMHTFSQRFFRTSCFFQQESKANLWSIWTFNRTCNFKIQNTTSPKSSQRQGINVLKDVADILQPIVENKIVTTFKTKLNQNITCNRSVVSPGEPKKSWNEH